MAIDSDKLLEIVNRHREQLQTETDTIADGAAVAAFLLLTFALDHRDDKTIDEQIRRYMIECASRAVDEAQEIGLMLAKEH